MTHEELVARLIVYKKEIYARGLWLALCGLLPASIAYAIIGLNINLIDNGLWKFGLFLGSFLFIIFSLMIAFIYMIHSSLPKKLDLNCPECHTFIMNGKVEELIKTGNCTKCGAQIITADSQQTATTDEPIENKKQHT